MKTLYASLFSACSIPPEDPIPLSIGLDMKSKVTLVFSMVFSPVPYYFYFNFS
jgi:hypothetical protein